MPKTTQSSGLAGGSLPPWGWGRCQGFTEEAGSRGASEDVAGSFPRGVTERSLGTGLRGGTNTRGLQALASGRPGPLLGKGEAKPGRWGFDPASPCLGDSVATSIPSLTTPLGPHAADRNAEERAAPPALDFAGEQKALWRFPRKRKGGKRPPDAGGRGALIGDLPPWGEADERGESKTRASRTGLGPPAPRRLPRRPPGAALCGRSERVRVGGAQRGPGWPARLASCGHGAGPRPRPSGEGALPPPGNPQPATVPACTVLCDAPLSIKRR